MCKTLVVFFLVSFCLNIELEASLWFSMVGVSHFKAPTLDKERNLLYVGARDAIFALSTSSMQPVKSITWEVPQDRKDDCILKGKSATDDCFNSICFLQIYSSSQMYACGTYSYKPMCVFINLDDFSIIEGSLEDGNGKCPYDPTKGQTGLLVGDKLYTATLTNFLGSESVIQRTSKEHDVLTTEHNLFNDPNFVGSAYFQESEGSEEEDDDKIYFFFNEKAMEYDWETEQVVARVARVCKGDLGGAYLLQKKWTTFLKARLVCSLPEKFVHFNRLQGIYVLRRKEWWDSTIFGVFRAHWADVDISAVCQYPIQNVLKVFEGPYKKFNEDSQKWVQYYGDVPSPRPGACITKTARSQGFSSSLEIPSQILGFVRNHPLMADMVKPQDNQPVLHQKSVNFTQVVAHQVESLMGKVYTVLYIGTDNGWLRRAVLLPSGAHYLPAMWIFDRGWAINSLLLDSDLKVLFVVSSFKVHRVSITECRYSTCENCVGAKDPYCGWDTRQKRCILTDDSDKDPELIYQDLESETYPSKCYQPHGVSPEVNAHSIKNFIFCSKCLVRNTHDTCLSTLSTCAISNHGFCYSRMVIQDGVLQLMEKGCMFKCVPSRFNSKDIVQCCHDRHYCNNNNTIPW